MFWDRRSLLQSAAALFVPFFGRATNRSNPEVAAALERYLTAYERHYRRRPGHGDWPNGRMLSDFNHEPITPGLKKLEREIEAANGGPREWEGDLQVESSRNIEEKSDDHHEFWTAAHDLAKAVIRANGFDPETHILSLIPLKAQTADAIVIISVHNHGDNEFPPPEDCAIGIEPLTAQLRRRIESLPDFVPDDANLNDFTDHRKALAYAAMECEDVDDDETA